LCDHHVKLIELILSREPLPKDFGLLLRACAVTKARNAQANPLSHMDIQYSTRDIGPLLVSAEAK
jgi:hypothetical protein